MISSIYRLYTNPPPPYNAIIFPLYYHHPSYSLVSHLTNPVSVLSEK